MKKSKKLIITKKMKKLLVTKKLLVVLVIFALISIAIAFSSLYHPLGLFTGNDEIPSDEFVPAYIPGLEPGLGDEQEQPQEEPHIAGPPEDSGKAPEEEPHPSEQEVIKPSSGCMWGGEVYKEGDTHNVPLESGVDNHCVRWETYEVYKCVKKGWIFSHFEWEFIEKIKKTEKAEDSEICESVYGPGECRDVGLDSLLCISTFSNYECGLASGECKNFCSEGELSVGECRSEKTCCIPGDYFKGEKLLIIGRNVPGYPEVMRDIKDIERERDTNVIPVDPLLIGVLLEQLKEMNIIEHHQELIVEMHGDPDGKVGYDIPTGDIIDTFPADKTTFIVCHGKNGCQKQMCNHNICASPELVYVFYDPETNRYYVYDPAKEMESSDMVDVIPNQNEYNKDYYKIHDEEPPGEHEWVRQELEKERQKELEKQKEKQAQEEQAAAEEEPAQDNTPPADQQAPPEEPAP